MTIHALSGVDDTQQGWLTGSVRFAPRKPSAWEPSGVRFSPAPHGPVKRVDRHLVKAMEALRAAEHWRAHGVNQLSPETYAFLGCTSARRT